MKHDIKLLLADVDGTLVDKDKVLTPRAIAAVQALKQKGIQFAITSGRPPRGMAMLVEPLALTTPMAGFNGGVFVNPDLSVISTKTLSEEAARETIALIEKSGLYCWIYTGADWIVRDTNIPHEARETSTVRFPPRVEKTFPDEALKQLVKIVGISDDLPHVAEVEKLLQRTLGDRASAARSQPHYIDITNPQANKGAVLAELSKMLEIPHENICTMGDMPNDISMFKPAGFSIAMGQASDEVKAAASATTDGYNDDGFAKAVEKYILGQGA
jgi:Cof subfamily protein (haloacid dehalogenase superfamily)